MAFAISDEVAQAAFDVLQSNRHALAKLVYDRTDRERKALLARLEREANGKTLRDRETYALTHPHYTALLERLEAAEREYYLARDERDSAETVMRTWQTLRADARAGNVR